MKAPNKEEANCNPNSMKSSALGTPTAITTEADYIILQASLPAMIVQEAEWCKDITSITEMFGKHGRNDTDAGKQPITNG